MQRVTNLAITLKAKNFGRETFQLKCTLIFSRQMFFKDNFPAKVLGFKKSLFRLTDGWKGVYGKLIIDLISCIKHLPNWLVITEWYNSNLREKSRVGRNFSWQSNSRKLIFHQCFDSYWVIKITKGQDRCLISSLFFYC